MTGPFRAFVAFVLSLAGWGTVNAQPVGQSDAPAGAIVARSAAGPFEPMPANPSLVAEQLLVIHPDAAITDQQKRVRLTSRADFLGLSPMPILETAVVLHKPATAALDVTLDRGRIELQNLAQTPTEVVLTFARQKWVVTLGVGDSRVAVEVSGRWPAGTDFRPNPMPGYEPTMSALLLQLSGTSTVATGTTTVALSAPPGPAILNWTSADHREPTLSRLDRLPEWATADAADPKAAGMSAALKKFRQLRGEQPAAALDTFLNSANSDERRLGLVVAGAEDDLTRLAKGITEATEPEVWDFGTTVLRHWLGRGPGQEQKFHRFLTDARQYSTAEAATLIRLLNGFTPQERSRPELYDVLIEYLRHDRAAFRNMAAWHLVRLAPAAPAVPFRPNASKADFEAVYLKWRSLIPSGTVPKPATK